VFPYCIIMNMRQSHAEIIHLAYFKTRKRHRTSQSSGLTILLRIREVPGSNLGLEDGYREFFVSFLSQSW
jgi:hypothetical protein